MFQCKAESQLNTCRFCLKHVSESNGIRCIGACKKWAHYKCLNIDTNTIKAIKKGLLLINHACPNCEPRSIKNGWNSESQWRLIHFGCDSHVNRVPSRTLQKSNLYPCRRIPSDSQSEKELVQRLDNYDQHDECQFQNAIEKFDKKARQSHKTQETLSPCQNYHLKCSPYNSPHCRGSPHEEVIKEESQFDPNPIELLYSKQNFVLSATSSCVSQPSDFCQKLYSKLSLLQHGHNNYCSPLLTNLTPIPFQVKSLSTHLDCTQSSHSTISVENNEDKRAKENLESDDWPVDKALQTPSVKLWPPNAQYQNLDCQTWKLENKCLAQDESFHTNDPVADRFERFWKEAGYSMLCVNKGNDSNSCGSETEYPEINHQRMCSNEPVKASEPNFRDFALQVLPSRETNEDKNKLKNASTVTQYSDILTNGRPRHLLTTAILQINETMDTIKTMIMRIASLYEN